MFMYSDYTKYPQNDISVITRINFEFIKLAFVKWSSAFVK